MFYIKHMNLGQYLTYLREEAGLKKVEIANSVGVTPTYISNIEHGRNSPPDYDLCVKIVHALNLNQSQRKKFLELAFEERLKGDSAFLKEIHQSTGQLSENETEKISKEVLHAIQDPVALKALLITHKGSDDVKRALRQLLETFPSMNIEKRKAILALCQ